LRFIVDWLLINTGLEDTARVVPL